MHLGLRPLALLLLLVLCAGCSVSASSVSISKSVSSPFKMVSSLSTSSRGPEFAYGKDVAEYTAAYVKSGGQYEAFQRHLGELAAEHGITDWEANHATYFGIGEGLARAQVKGVALDTWIRNIANGDPEKTKAIQEGYSEEGGR